MRNCLYDFAMTQIALTPIGWVRSNVTASKEDYWGNIVSTIELENEQLESGALKGLEEFSHVEVLFHLSEVPESSIERGGRHPRNNPNWLQSGDIGTAGQKSTQSHCCNDMPNHRSESEALNRPWARRIRWLACS